MQQLYRYNWQVRDEWFDLCGRITDEELSRKRIGGIGSILYTLFHIVDVEMSWILWDIERKHESREKFEDYATVGQIKALSDLWRPEIERVLETWERDADLSLGMDWTDERYTKREILNHVAAHEIHHMGQLSIWARELGMKPVSANLIERGLA